MARHPAGQSEVGCWDFFLQVLVPHSYQSGCSECWVGIRQREDGQTLLADKEVRITSGTQLGSPGTSSGTGCIL